MLSTSDRQYQAAGAGRSRLSARRNIDCIPTAVMDAMTSARAPTQRSRHRSAISTIIVLIILSTVKTYSAATATDVNSTTTTTSTVGPVVAPNLVDEVTGSNSTEQSVGDNVTVTSVSSVASQVANLSMSTNGSSSSLSTDAAAIGVNPLQTNGSSWSINNSTLSTGDREHRNHSDLISHLQCEYGTVRSYSFSSVVQSRLAANGSTRATVLVRCLHQVTWGIGDQQDRLNGQKYIAYITDFYTDALDGPTGRRSKRKSPKERSKRSVTQMFEHLWSDIKSMLPFEEETTSGHDDFDQDLLRSMEGELRSKCHSLLFWEEFQSLHGQRPDKCIHCHANPLSKFSLPFWFIQLYDGSIPQIRFTKQEVNHDVKNFKKLVTSLLATQLNASNSEIVEKSVLGVHRSHYRTLKDTSTNANISPEQTVIERHIDTADFLIEQNKELHLSSDKFPLNITASLLQHIDTEHNQIISSNGRVTTAFGPSDLSLYSTTITEHKLEREQVTNRKIGDLLNELQEMYFESQKETLVAEPIKEEALLQEKYSDSLYRLRAKLGRNEYHYYTKLFDGATKKEDDTEYQSLLRLVVLEQQLNHSMHQHNSLIGDLRRIGTVHNIQLVCGPNLAHLVDSDQCAAFLYLLLQSSSKTAQHVLLYNLQNQGDTEPSAKATMAARLLAQTYRPSRWLIENLAHETHHQAANRATESLLMQTLVQIAQREQLVKLKELISVHLVKRLRDTLLEPASTTSELYTIDLLEMLGSLGNYSALQSVQEGLAGRWQASDLVTIATIHAYRRSINRSQVQSSLCTFFLSANSCQIKQQIVQLLIDDVDRMFWAQTKDKRWPKYGFEQLDQILADELRNSSTNCVHSLVIEYFKRKVNSNARKLVSEFEASHHYNSTSFDFCITEHANYKCDYVQTLGNELASVEMRKSISIAKTALNGSRQSPPQSTYIYTCHSLSTVIYKYKLTVAHLSVIQMRQSDLHSQLLVQLQTQSGDAIPLASVRLTSGQLQANSSAVKIAQMKLTVPVKVAATEHSPQADNALLVSMEAFFAVYLQPDLRPGEPTGGTLRIQISLQSTGEFAYSGLALQRSIDLQTNFEYESKQPLEIWSRGAEPATEQQPRNVSNNRNGNNEAIRLGTEHFAGQVQLWHHSNKHYDAQCNIWMDQSASQQLSHWNSTVKQSNLFVLPLQPLQASLPVVATEVATGTFITANQSVQSVANSSRITTT